MIICPNSHAEHAPRRCTESHCAFIKRTHITSDEFLEHIRNDWFLFYTVEIPSKRKNLLYKILLLANNPAVYEVLSWKYFEICTLYSLFDHKCKYSISKLWNICEASWLHARADHRNVLQRNLVSVYSLFRILFSRMSLNRSYYTRWSILHVTRVNSHPHDVDIVIYRNAGIRRLHSTCHSYQRVARWGEMEMQKIRVGIFEISGGWIQSVPAAAAATARVKLVRLGRETFAGEREKGETREKNPFPSQACGRIARITVDRVASREWLERQPSTT